MDDQAFDQWCRDLAGHSVKGYTLQKFVGAGKIGYVYRAEHEDFPGLDKAVKLIFGELKPGWDEELKKVLRLSLVPGVVHFYHLDTAHLQHNGYTHVCTFTVWDYIAPGRNLKQYLAEVPRIDTSFLVAVLERILHVLVACEEKGVARHGDLHAGNILIGNPSDAMLDESLCPRMPIYVSDFGYGATGGKTKPKDDYRGLCEIINQMISKVDYALAPATDRKLLQKIQLIFGKFLNESIGSERRQPLELLRLVRDIKLSAQAQSATLESSTTDVSLEPQENWNRAEDVPRIGHFQVAEMIGDRWTWWRKLFVATVPARSKILSQDIPTVVTGPRGCGKTMLFRRLSERLVIECGVVKGIEKLGEHVGLYVNANDFADAFARYPTQPSQKQEEQLVCYANLCVLAELLTVESARSGRLRERPSATLLEQVSAWLIPDTYATLLEGEDQLERCRAVLEKIKWSFPKKANRNSFPGYVELCQHRWLPHFIRQLRASCKWIGNRSLLLFVDDFSTPRVSVPMQKTLNRLFFQRSPDFLVKLATEASSSFVSEESSGKNLQDGDDYQLVDMGEEALFLPDHERQEFLNKVFARRLSLDSRIPVHAQSLAQLLDTMPLSKTEFARRLREHSDERSSLDEPAVHRSSQRRGRSRARVNYYGANVLCDLWSGDTRTMIQLVTDVVDQSEGSGSKAKPNNEIEVPINHFVQDRVFRNRGGEWLTSHTRNEPTDPAAVRRELERIRTDDNQYKLCGPYGEHLKAIVEAFVAVARKQLLGPTYSIVERENRREVPRMAFRIEVTDDFRIEGLAREIYRDLVRYGLFMRDSRGKSVRGTFVPRLYLRRLLLPYSALALSKRDSVQLSCAMFVHLLLSPDTFRAQYAPDGRRAALAPDQTSLPFNDIQPDPAYDDL